MQFAIRAVAAAAAIALFSGCYTQFSAVQRGQSSSPPPCPDSLADSCDQARAAAAQVRDTVVVRDDRRQVCSWTRNFWGDPVLRCYRSYYSDDWIGYYSDPWWNSSYDSWYGYRNCPSYYYYDPYTGYCRYGHDYNSYYAPQRGTSRHSTGGTSAGQGTPRPRTDGVPGQPASRGTGIPKEAAADAPITLPQPGGSTMPPPSTIQQGRDYSTTPPATQSPPAASKASEPVPQPVPATGVPASGSVERRQSDGPQQGKGKAGQPAEKPAEKPAQQQQQPAAGSQQNTDDDKGKPRKPRSW